MIQFRFLSYRCVGWMCSIFPHIFTPDNFEDFSLPVVHLSTAKGATFPPKNKKKISEMMVMVANHCWHHLCFVSIIWRHWFRIHVLNKRPHRFSNWQRILLIFCFVRVFYGTKTNNKISLVTEKWVSGVRFVVWTLFFLSAEPRIIRQKDMKANNDTYNEQRTAGILAQACCCVFRMN